MAGALTWDQIRDMARQGIEFGSHSVSHPILTKLDDRALDHELTASLQTIKRELGTCLDVLAYPEGSTSAFDARVVEATKRAGYRLGLSYVSGTNILDRFDPFRVKRMHIDCTLPFIQFRALLAMPRLFSIELSRSRAAGLSAP
jgi:peptidoglycan/xylan/chitin deacetylase (PgdA/CDA1 family)